VTGLAGASMETIDPYVLRSLADAQPDMYWSDADPLETEAHSALIGSETTELVVVGAGYTGLWTALLAKEANPDRDVVIIEQRETGAGASGRNGGFVVASLTHGFQNGKNRWPDEIGTIERMGRENLAAIEETIHRYGIECDWERTGELKVAVEPWQLIGMEEEAAERNELGDLVEFLDAETVTKMIHSPTYHGAVFDHDGTALVDPARLVWGLERACISLGVRIYENTKVQWLEREKDGIRVHTTFGEIFTKKVALATNVFKPVVRSARKYIVPVYDYVLVTEPLTKAQHDSIGWSGREGIGDAGNQFHYYRQTSDGGILWGGWDAIYHPGGKVRQEYEFRPESFAVLASHFFKTFPQLEGIRFTHMWGGAIDTCSRFAPFWGLSRDKRVGYALGYTGLGVAATRFGAQVMLDLLDGHETERTKLSMVQKKPIPFPPEPFKYIAIQITRWSIHRADRRNGKRNLWLKILDRFGLGFDS